MEGVGRYGVKREKYEYEDLRRVAEERKISLAESGSLLGNGLTPRQPAKEYRRRTADASAAFRAEQGRHT